MTILDKTNINPLYFNTLSGEYTHISGNNTVISSETTYFVYIIPRRKTNVVSTRFYNPQDEVTTESYISLDDKGVCRLIFDVELKYSSYNFEVSDGSGLIFRGQIVDKNKFDELDINNNINNDKITY